MIRALIMLLMPFAAQADVVRIASFNTELSRKGPGLLLRDIQRDDAQVQAVVAVLSAVRPDIIALQGLDWDLDGLAVAALTDELNDAGLSYPYSFSAKPNSGVETNYDLDGDGRRHGPGDAQGWGRFTGAGGLAVLSKFKIVESEVQDYSDLLWRDLPGATLPTVNSQPYPSVQAQSVQRLSSTGHWIVPIKTPAGRLSLMTFHATPPVFDGPEDRNGLRNQDEVRFWSVLLNGEFGTAPEGHFVIAGDANLDPERGDGRTEAIQNLLSHPRVQDVEPKDSTGALTTVHWKSAGEMRVDYVLPSADLWVKGSGVFWPEPDSQLREVAQRASRHRLVWVDVNFP